MFNAIRELVEEKNDKSKLTAQEWADMAATSIETAVPPPRRGRPMPITITLRQIFDAGPCYDPRVKGLLPASHDLDAPISFREIVKKVGAEDAIWCFSILPGHDSLKRHFAVDCADRIKHLMTDERSINALSVARRHAIGQATYEELAAARVAARDASRVAVLGVAWAVVWDAARIAAWAADSGDERAWQAARLIELTEAGEWSPVKPFG